MLIVEATFDSQLLAGLPGQRVCPAVVIFIPEASLAWCIAAGIARVGDVAVIFDGIEIELAAVVEVRGDAVVEMAADLLHVAAVVVVGILGRRLAAVGCQFACGQVSGLFSLVVVSPGNHASCQVSIVGGKEPFAANTVFFGFRVVAIAIRVLLRGEVVLREAVRLPSYRHLHFPSIETAISDPAVGVVSTLTGGDIDVAANVVQAVARVVGAANDFDVLDVEREDHVEIAHVPAVDIARNTVDQQFDAIDVTLAVERPKGGFAGFCTQAEFRELDARHLADQFPTVGDVFVLNAFGAHDIHRGEDAPRGQGAGAGRADADFSKDDGRFLRVRAGHDQRNRQENPARFEWVLHRFSPKTRV